MDLSEFHEMLMDEIRTTNDELDRLIGWRLIFSFRKVDRLTAKVKMYLGLSRKILDIQWKMLEDKNSLYACCKKQAELHLELVQDEDGFDYDNGFNLGAAHAYVDAMKRIRE